MTAAFFSKGFHHLDEHFQILEFAGLKLGLTLPSDLPWEFSSQIRSTFQPFIVVLIHRLIALFNLDDPFFVAFILRFMSGVLSWFTFMSLLKTFGKEIPEKWFSRLTVPFSLFFSIAIYNGVRFSSENWGGIFFALGLCWALQVKSRILAPAFFSGVLLGISFLSRFQMGLMIFGLILWLIVIKKETWSRLLVGALGFCFILFLGTFLDHFFYGGWPLTFWNYFEQNLLLGKAAQFGVQPWHEYFRLLFLKFLPPFSLSLIVGLLAFFYFYPRHVISFSLAPFLLVHLMIGHKEARFLFPLLYFFPVILGLGYSALYQQLNPSEKVRWFLRGCLRFFWIVNSFFLILVMFHPASKDTELYEAIYRARPQKLIFSKTNPFNQFGLDLKYYRPRGLEIVSGNETSELESGVKTLVATLDLNREIPEDREVYRSAPKWLERFNFNHWLQRTKLWVVFWQ